MQRIVPANKQLSLQTKSYHCKTHLRNSRPLRAVGDSNNDSDVPWNISTYYSKKKNRVVDPVTKELLQTPNNIAEPPGFNTEAKLKLSIRILASKYLLTEDEVRGRPYTAIKLKNCNQLTVSSISMEQLLKVIRTLFSTADSSDTVKWIELNISSIYL